MKKIATALAGTLATAALTVGGLTAPASAGGGNNGLFLLEVGVAESASDEQHA